MPRLAVSFKLAALLGAIIAGQVYAGVDHIRWSSKDDPLNGLTLGFSSTSGSCKIKWGYTAGCEKGEATPNKTTDYRSSDYLYHFTFPNGLNASSTIHYSIYDGSAWGSGKTFKTSPAVNTTKFTFLAGGDSRSLYTDTKPTGWGSVSSKLKALPYDYALQLYTGDVAYTSGATHWDDWYSYGAEYLEKALVYHCVGNHDGGGGIIENQFVQPGNELYYSFTMGDVLFVCLNSQTRDSDTQYNWLQTQLKNNTKTWTVVWFHMPFYTGSKHPEDMIWWFDTWWKTCDDYGVDVIIGGHCHNYMRSKPINRKGDGSADITTNFSVAEYGSETGQGRCQIVAGGFGAGKSAASTGWFVASTTSNYHWCRFDVDGGTMKLTTTDVDGKVVDQLTLSKGVVSAASSDLLAPSGLKIAAVRQVAGTGLRISLGGNFRADGVRTRLCDVSGRTVEARVFDANGREDGAVILGGMSAERRLLPGTYIVHVTDGEQKAVQRVTLLP